MSDEGAHPKPQVSLLDLPAEILGAICANLCHHCCGPTDLSTLLWPAPRCRRIKYDRSPLVNLSLVCRSLRDAAQPVLFHLASFRIKPRSNRVLSDVMWRLLRSLQERPDLRPHMRLVDIVLQAYPPIPYPKKDTGSKQARQMATDMSQEAGLSLPREDVLDPNVGEILVQILLAILPNLGEIRLVYPRK